MSTVPRYRTPPFLPRKPTPDLGTQRISGERYYSPEFMQREWTHVWTKVWNLGPRAHDIPEPGDFITHELGKESFVFVRGDDNVIRGFFNVCQHRGNQLCQAPLGSVSHFQCPYHGWQWNIDGSLRQVADPQFFRQFDRGVPRDELALPPVKVALWGGWIWFNMDLAARSLEDYLGAIIPHLAPYEFEHWTLVDYRTFEFESNWKHAVDAFNESYHFLALHPQTAGWAEGYDAANELLGIHNRMHQMVGTVSVKGPLGDAPSPELKVMMKDWLQIDPETYTGTAKDVYLEVRRRKRAVQDDTYLPYRQMNDEQLSDLYHYTIFPNFILNIQPEFGFLFRVRPHAKDPERCYYDHFLMQYLPPGSPQPTYEHRCFAAGEAPDFFVAFENKLDRSAADVQTQDASNLEPIQRGCKSDSFKGAILGEQEIGVRHFHQVLDGFLSGARTA